MDYRGRILDKMTPEQRQRYLQTEATRMLRSNGYTADGRPQKEKPAEEIRDQKEFERGFWGGMQCRSRRNG